MIYTLNNKLNGIEVSFDTKPDVKILSNLKENGFRWHPTKKIWYAKNTTETLNFVKSLEIKEENIETKSKKEVTPEHPIKVGDVLYSSWGYEQTNIDFYQVIRLRGKKQIVVRPIASKRTRSLGYCSDMVKPIKDNFRGEPMIKTVKGTNEYPYCNGEYGNMYLTSWDMEHNETSYY